MDITELLGMGGGGAQTEPAEELRKAAWGEKLDRVDPNVVREFIALYWMPLKETVQRALLEDPENINVMEGRSATIDQAYIDGLTDEDLKDSDRALDVIGHAILVSNGEEATYLRWLEARAKARAHMFSTKHRLRSTAKEYLRAEREGRGESQWLFNFIDVGAVNRQGNSFTIRKLFEAGISAREYLRKRLGTGKKYPDDEITVSVDVG